jgi:hypothetical protein
MASSLYPLSGLPLLLPTIPSLHSCRTRSCPAPWSFRSGCSHRVASPRTSYTPRSPGPLGCPQGGVIPSPYIARSRCLGCQTGATRSSENTPSTHSGE